MIKSDLITLVKSAFPGASSIILETIETSCYLNTNEGWVGEFATTYDDSSTKMKLTVEFRDEGNVLHIYAGSCSQLWAITQHEMWKRNIGKQKEETNEEQDKI